MGGGVRASGTTAAVAVAICLMGTPAALAGPRAGERYDGRSATGQRIYLSVHANGRRLSRYTFIVTTRCSDGRRRPLFHRDERRVPIDAAGQFGHRSAAPRGFYPTRSGRVQGRFRISFSGRFDAPGDSVTGTIRATFRSRRFDCSSGPVEFTAYRDGTAMAPWRDPLMATGLYTARGRGVTARLNALAPGRELLRAVIGYRVRCRFGGTLISVRSFLNYRLGEEGRLSVAGRGSFRIPHDGVSVRTWFRLKLRFFESGGHRVSGVWWVRAVVSRDGRPIDTCGMRRAFSGSLRSGPV
jgi:hypothetical protein